MGGHHRRAGACYRAPGDDHLPGDPRHANGDAHRRGGPRRLRGHLGRHGPRLDVTPSVARVHGYLLIWGSLLTERDVREALGLSHRAASLALAELEEWGLVERVEDARRRPDRAPGRGVARGGRPVALVPARGRGASGSRGRPLQPRLAVCIELAEQVVAASPHDLEARRLRDWLAESPGFVTLFERALVRWRARRPRRSPAASLCFRASPTRRSTACCASSASLPED